MNFPVVKTGNQQGQCDVVEYGLVLQQLVILENHADLLSHPGCVTRAGRTEVSAVDGDLAATWPLEHQDHAQEGAFTRTRMTGKKCHFSRFEVKADVTKGADATFVPFADVLERDHFSLKSGTLFFGAAPPATRGIPARAPPPGLLFLRPPLLSFCGRGLYGAFLISGTRSGSECSMGIA